MTTQEASRLLAKTDIAVNLTNEITKLFNDLNTHENLHNADGISVSAVYSQAESAFYKIMQDMGCEEPMNFEPKITALLDSMNADDYYPLNAALKSVRDLRRTIPGIGH